MSLSWVSVSGNIRLGVLAGIPSALPAVILKAGRAHLGKMEGLYAHPSYIIGYKGRSQSSLNQDLQQLPDSMLLRSLNSALFMLLSFDSCLMKPVPSLCRHRSRRIASFRLLTASAGPDLDKAVLRTFRRLQRRNILQHLVQSLLHGFVIHLAIL